MPSVAVGPDGVAWVVVRSTFNALWLNSLAPTGFGTTPTWIGIATALDSPAAGIHVDNVVAVTVIRGGQVWSAPFFVASQSWGTWSPLGQAATSASAASDQTSLAVAARDPAGQLVWYRAGLGWSNYGTSFAGGPLSAAPTGRSTSFGSFPTTIETSPPGLTVSVDGLNCTAPCTFQWFPGSSHTIAAPTSQQFAGSTYWHSYWSNGLGRTRTFCGRRR